MATIKIRKKYPIIRYPSSLIQQNHGESLQGHGYSLWDLKSRTYKHVEIQNDFGFFTVVLDNGKIISSLDNIPKKSRVKFQMFETLATEVKSATSQLQLLTDVIETSFGKIENTSPTKISSSDGNVLLGNITDSSYQEKLIREFMKNRLNIVDDDFINSVIKVNGDTNAVIKKDDFARNIRWIPIRFEWDNMFSYGEQNVIDFTKLKDVVGIFAANASGKSSVFSSLSFCIFDKCEREYKAANILNSQRSHFQCKFEFEIDGKRYFIQRKGKADKKGNVKVEVKFWTLINGEEVELHGEDRRDTNELIRDYVGTYEDFILTAMSVQNGKNNGSVIDMGHSERKDLLAQFMGLSVFDRLNTEANEKLKELNGVLKTFKNDDYTKELITYQDALTQAEGLFKEESDLVSAVIELRDEIQKNISDVTQTLIKIDVNIPPLEESESTKSKNEISLKLTKDSIKKSEELVVEIQSKLPPIQSEIDVLETKNILVAYKNYQISVNKRSSNMASLEKKKMEISHRKEKVDREKNHQYNPTCKFCMAHSSTIVSEALTAKEEIENDKVIVSNLLKERDEIAKEIKDLEWADEAHSTYNQLLFKRNSVKDQLISTTKILDSYKSNITVFESLIKTAVDNIELYNKNKSDLLTNVETNKKIQSLKLELSNVELNLKNKNKLILDTNGKISVYKTKIDSINKKVKDAQEMELQHKIYDVYVQAVSRDGIPFDVISVTVPEVEREVNSILSQISTFSAKFETDGKNIVPYIVYDNTKWLMSLTSGFEKFALSLAIRVALINISSLPRPNFLVLDEGFGVLDAENLSSMQVLFSYLKSNFDFILVVSHLEAMRDMVDSQIEITKDTGFSKVNYV